MNTRGLAGALVVGLLGVTMTTVVSEPATADDDGSIVARAPLAGRPVPAHYVRILPMVVTEDGRTLVTITTAGISKYVLTRHSVTRVGRSAATPDDKRLDLEVTPDGRFAYVTDQPLSGPEASRVQVFDLRRDRPRLVRTLKFPDLGRIHDTEISPDGQRLFLRAYQKLQVLRLDHPARPEREPFLEEPHGYGPLTVTRDGTHLVTALSEATRGVGDTIHVWDITRPGAPTLEREGTVRIPGEDTASWIDEMEISPQADALYVKSGYCNDVCEDSYTETTRLRFSDLVTEAQTVAQTGSRYEFLRAVSNGGGKVFMQWVDVRHDKSLVWLDPQLTTPHIVRGVGAVRGMALSPGGKTRGTAYVAGHKSGKTRIFAVRF